MKKDMLINVLQPEEIRIAIIEDGVLEELYVERTSHESYVGNIYKGRVVNIEASIQAAFIDFGVGRNGFLHVSDVEPAYYAHLEQGYGRRDERQGRGSGGVPRGRGRRDEQGGAPRQKRGEPRQHFDAPPQAEVDEGPREPSAAERHAAAFEELAAGRATAEPGLSDLNDDPANAPSEGDEKEASSRGRRRGRGRGSRKPRGERPAAETTEFMEPPAENPPGPDDDRPRLMESSEHRTDADDLLGGQPRRASDLTDEDLSFSMAREEPARREPERVVAREPASQPKAWQPPPRSEEEPEPFDEPISFDEALAPEPARQFDDEDEDELDDEPTEETGVDVDFDEDYEPDLEGYEEREGSAPRRPEGGSDRPAPRRGGPRNGQRGGPRRMMGGRPGTGRPKPPIQEIFKRGQEVLVQVIKEGIGTKGPTLSTYISIAGRYLVLMPGLQRIGVSRKIDDDETRRRLREILGDLRPPRGLGFIIRTAGQDRNKKELQGDLAYLSRLWEVVAKRIQKIKSPAEIYQESDMVTRTIRDIFTNDIDNIWVDEKSAYEAAKEFLTIVMPRYANRIRYYEGPEPMFHKHGIEQEIARIQQRHVPLAHGGSIVIDQTEALVAIDVNSGNFRADNNAEETAYRMNLQAAKEIARQLRLRDLGGVIVNDFIDMREERHRRDVERALRDAVQRDRARTKILRISQFGIIEMTRQRIRPSLKRSVYQDCAHCHGTGQVKTCESMSIEVMRLLQLAIHRIHIQRIEVRVHDSVAQFLLNRKRKEIVQLEEHGGRAISVRTAGLDVSPEFLDFLCYDSNNNEVKFMHQEEPPRSTRRRH